MRLEHTRHKQTRKTLLPSCPGDGLHLGSRAQGESGVTGHADPEKAAEGRAWLGLLWLVQALAPPLQSQTNPTLVPHPPAELMPTPALAGDLV